MGSATLSKVPVRAVAGAVALAVSAFCLCLAASFASVAWAAQGQGAQSLSGGGASLSIQATRAGHYTDAKTESEKNDSIGSANAVALNKYVYGAFTKTDDHDFFKVKVPRAGVYTLSFVGDTVGGSGTWSVCVYDSDRAEVLSNTYSANELSRSDWTVELSAGAAYIEVYGCTSLWTDPPKLSTAYHVRLKGELASSARVTGVSSKTYNGKAQTQSKLAVKIGSKTLKKNTDYTVSYKKNTNAGTATITIKGKGGYQGTITKTFRIAKAKASKFAVSKVAAKKYKKGKAIKPAPTVKFNGKKLKKGKDYTLSYKNNKKRGTAKIVIKGKGNFTGTKTVSFRIR